MQEGNQTNRYIALASLAIALCCMLFRGDSLMGEFEYTWNNILAIVFLMVAFVCIGIPLVSSYLKNRKGRRGTTELLGLNDHMEYVHGKDIDDRLVRLLEEHSTNLSTLLSIVASKQRGGEDAETSEETTEEGGESETEKESKESGKT